MANVERPCGVRGNLERAEQLARVAMRELGDDPEALAVVIEVMRAMAAEASRRPEVI